MEKKYGRIVPPYRILKTQIGYAAVVKGGRSYDLKISLSRTQHLPVVSCVETGKTFVLPWKDILYLADAAGLLDQ